MWYFARHCHQTNHGSIGSAQIVTCLLPSSIFFFPSFNPSQPASSFSLTYKQTRVAFASVFQPYAPLCFLRLFAAAFQSPHNLPLRASPMPFPSFAELIQNPLKSTEDLLLPSRALGSALQFLFKTCSLYKAFSCACLCCLTHSQSELSFFSSDTTLQCFVLLIFWVSVEGYNQMAALDLFRVFGKVTSLLAISYLLLSLCAALGYVCIARV